MNYKEEMLIEKRLILLPEFHVNEDEKRRAYLNAFLLVNFGIELENPEYVNDKVLQMCEELLRLFVPDGFYENPQDTRFFDHGELVLEQVISYFVGYGTPLKRVELFHKTLPQYVIGDEIKTRRYRIINKTEGDKVLREMALNYASYTRPFSNAEKMRFVALMRDGYITEEVPIRCRDNLFPLLPIYPNLAKQMDKKDLVKYSTSTFLYSPPRYYSDLGSSHETELKVLERSIDLVRDCPLSKKQAKYFNKLCKIFKGKKGKETNHASPYKEMMRLMREEGPVATAHYLSNQGSLLIRNLKYLLSRVKNHEEVEEILDCIDGTNPIVLIQLYRTLSSDEPGVPRTFVYRRFVRVVSYVETDLEAKCRKSILPEETLQFVREILFQKIQAYYSALPKFGKIYLPESFRRVAVPVSSASTGRGVDILPSGSRIPFSAEYLRVFCYWDGIRDIDASLGVFTAEDLKIHKEIGLNKTLSWRTYSSKPFGDDALCSGDDTSYNGVEYQDICVEGLRRQGCRYAVAAINGYGGPFNTGEIVQGVQIKNNLNTQAWDPKNIEFQMQVEGDEHAFTGFAIDLKTKEIVVINALCSGNQLFGRSQIDICRRYLHPGYLELNMFDLLSCRGERVDRPEEADVVFDADYQSETQKVIRPFDVNELLKIVNEKPQKQG